jgi:dGTPase
MGLLEREAFVYLLEPIIGQRCRDWEISRIRATAIQLWISEVADAFMKAEPDMMKGQQEHPLMEIIPSRNVIAQLNQTAVEACYKAPVVVKREVAASRVITELLEHLTGCALSEDPGQLLKTLVAGELPSSKIKRFQLAVDYVSGMTDRFALSLYRQLAGFDLAMG